MGLGRKIRNIIDYCESVRNNKNIQPVTVVKYQSDLLAEKNALIIGGTGGIGFAIAKNILDAGANVVITGTRDETINKAKSIIKRKGDQSCNGMILDLLDVNSFSSKLIEAEKLIGRRIDVVVNAAGYHGDEPFGKVTEKSYDRVLDINLKGVYFMTQAAGNYMKLNNIKGHILNVSSAASLKPAWTPYEVSKWGVRGITLGAADELVSYGIVVNAIGPGPVATRMLGYNQGDSLYTDCVPTERFATPDEIAQLAVIMVSDMCNLVIGDTFYITGGSGTVKYR